MIVNAWINSNWNVVWLRLIIPFVIKRWSGKLATLILQSIIISYSVTGFTKCSPAPTVSVYFLKLIWFIITSEAIPYYLEELKHMDFHNNSKNIQDKVPMPWSNRQAGRNKIGHLQKLVNLDFLRCSRSLPLSPTFNYYGRMKSQVIKINNKMGNIEIKQRPKRPVSIFGKR